MTDQTTNNDERGAKGLYFSHDSDAHNDDKIVPMIAVYGFTGYGWYWRILEQMRKLPEFKLKVGGKYGITSVAKMLNAPEPDVENWLNDCCDEFTGNDGHGLFVRDGEYIFSPSFVRRMAKAEKIRQINSANGKASAAKRAEMRASNPQPTPVQQGVNLSKSKSNRNSNSNNDSPTQKKKPGEFILQDQIVRESTYWVNDEFQRAWVAYAEKRKMKKKDMTERSCKTLLNELKRLCGENVQRATFLVDLAENSGWQFIYDRPDTTPVTRNTPKGILNNAYQNVADTLTD